MRKFFAVAMGSAVALLGFAGAANASATVDLLWLDLSTTNTVGNPICLFAKQRNCPTQSTLGVSPSTVVVSDNITLGVIITAGTQGVGGAGVSVDFNAAIPKLSVTTFRRFTTKFCGTVQCERLPANLGEPQDTTHVGWVQNINAAGGGPLAGLGLPASGTAYLGTVTFHKDQLINGTFEIKIGVNGPAGSDGITALGGANLGPSSSFNNAFLINVPEPGALSLLVMGVGGMLLAGRGRRS